MKETHIRGERSQGVLLANEPRTIQEWACSLYAVLVTRTSVLESIKPVDVNLTIAIVLPYDEVAIEDWVVLAERIGCNAALLATFQVVKINLAGADVPPNPAKPRGPPECRDRVGLE